ncbi:5343_t:CDS:2, partial [Dentiscutata heterogama]
IMMTKMEDTFETVSCIKSELIKIIEAAVNITDMISPIFPIAALINNIFTIHESVQLNEEISKFTIDQIVSAKVAIKFLKLLTKIKVYAEKLPQLEDIKAILNANSIRKKFIRLMKEYGACMRDLKFAMIVDDNILRDDLVNAVKVFMSSLS